MIGVVGEAVVAVVAVVVAVEVEAGVGERSEAVPGRRVYLRASVVGATVGGCSWMPAAVCSEAMTRRMVSSGMRRKRSSGMALKTPWTSFACGSRGAETSRMVLSSSLWPEQDGVVTAGAVSTEDDLSQRASVDRLTAMGVKSLWKLLTPVGRPVLYFSLAILPLPSPH